MAVSIRVLKNPKFLSRDNKVKSERENGNLFRQQRNYPLLQELRNFNYCDYLEPLVTLALNTGMRRGELFGLEWGHVDLEKEFLTVISGNSKSGKGRHIPLNKAAKEALSNWLNDTDNRGYVFKGVDEQPLKDIKKVWSICFGNANSWNHGSRRQTEV